MQTNVAGVQTLLDVARKTDVWRFVHLSTDEVYGDREGKKPAREDSRLFPSSPYAATKAAADLLCLAYQRTYKVPVLIVRSSNNYGPFQFPEKLVPLALRNIVAREDVPLYGDGMQLRDWMYVTDNCEAILSVLQEGTVGSVYNVGPGEERSNRSVVLALCELMADIEGLETQQLVDLVKPVADRPGHDRRYVMDARKVRRELGWRPKVQVDEGLGLTARWYLEHQDWIKQRSTQEYQRYREAVYTQQWGQTEA